MRLYLRSADRRPDPPPLRTDDRAVILTGMAVWALLLVAALAMHSRLAASDRGWWTWTPVVGILLGLYGLHYVRKRDARSATVTAPSATEPSAPTSSAPTRPSASNGPGTSTRSRAAEPATGQGTRSRRS